MKQEHYHEHYLGNEFYKWRAVIPPILHYKKLISKTVKNSYDSQKKDNGGDGIQII